MAAYYVGTTPGAPTATAQVYMDQARQALAQGVTAVNDFMTGDIAALRAAAATASIGLLSAAEPVNLPAK